MAVVTARDHNVYLSTDRSQCRKGNGVAAADVLGTQFLRIEDGPRLAMLVEHPVTTSVLVAGPKHLGKDTGTHEVQHGRGVESRAEDSLVEVHPHRFRIVRVRVQFAAYVEDVAPIQQPPDCPRAVSEVRRLGHEQAFVRNRIARRSVFAVIAPIRISVPVEKTDQAVVDLVDKAPGPVPPERLEPLDGRTPDQGLAPVQIWAQPTQGNARDLFVDAPVLLEAHRPTDPRVVGFIPDAPVPVADDFATPLLDTIPNDVSALIGEPPYGARIIQRTLQFGEGKHRNRTDVEDGLDIRRELWPLRYGVRRTLVEHKETNHSRVYFAKPRLDLPARGPYGKVGALVRLVHPVQHLHPDLVRITCRHTSLGRLAPLRH